MAASSRCSIFDTPFLLPSGFNPQGTEIVHGPDPKYGFFHPTDNSVRSFLLSKRDCGTTLFHTTPECLEAIHYLEPGKYRIVFVSPKIDVPCHQLPSSSSPSNYFPAMMEAWKSWITPSLSTPEPEKDVTKEVAFHIIKGKKKITVYKGDVLADVSTEASDVRVTKSTFGWDVNHEPNIFVADLYSSRSLSIKDKFLVFQQEGPKKMILGDQRIGKPLSIPVYEEIVASKDSCLVIHPIALPRVETVESDSYILRVIPYQESEVNFIVISDEFKDIILHRKNKIIGYRLIGAKVPKEMFERLYIDYDFDFDHDVVPFFYGSPTIYKSFDGTDDKIIAEGEFEGVVFGAQGDKMIAKGIGPQLEKMDRRLAATLIRRLANSDFVVPPEVVKGPELKFASAGGNGYSRILCGPFTGICLYVRPHCMYLPSSSVKNISPSLLEKFKVRYPDLVVLS